MQFKLQRIGSVGRHFFQGITRKNFGISAQGSHIPILTYHQIGLSKETDSPSIYLSRDDFQKHIEWLLRQKYEFVGLNEVVDAINRGKKASEKKVIITFDDGYEGIYQHAFPVLKKHKLMATVFLISNKIGTAEKFSYLDKAQIQELQRHGFEFGSHSLSHKDLSVLNETELISEVRDSKKKIEDLLGQACPHFCYPYGKWNQKVQTRVRDAGYQSACSSLNGRWNTAEDLFALKRIGISYQQTLLELWYGLEIMGWVSPEGLK